MHKPGGPQSSKLQRQKFPLHGFALNSPITSCYRVNCKENQNNHERQSNAKHGSLELMKGYVDVVFKAIGQFPFKNYISLDVYIARQGRILVFNKMLIIARNNRFWLSIASHRLR